ncbi:MAG: acyltransferase family protein [Microbacterium gubbeenense]|uniref:acyltransferase family protein n=1 Tax=Microbacterium gubbeenense TaxID=159896 RepID=UPI003F95EB5D
MTADAQRRGMRSEIQALRAVAVLAVVLYHLWPERLTGGFVGVDIFFVISGFLITSHLLREVRREGTVHLGQFWARRVRRLLPAAFVVLGVALAATLVLMPWSEWKQGLREIIASALYVENWALAFDSVDYLAAENSPTLVQHYWSLSVEEQFYIVWPLLILGALWVARRLKAGAVWQNRTMMIALIVVFIASILASVIWTKSSADSAYFATPTRAWEFAAGGLLAFLPARASAPSASRGGVVLHLIAAWGGLAAIGFTVVQYDGSVPFPSYTALLPVVGTVAVIWAGESAHSWSPTLIGKSGPIQWLGDVSYSLYLWHWPLVVLYPLVQGHPIGLKGGVGLLAVMIVLAWLSKRFIEDPFRRGQLWKHAGRSFGFAVTGMVAITAVSVVSITVIDAEIAAADTTKPPYASVQDLRAEVEETLASSTWAIPDQLGGRESQAEEWVVDNCIDVDSNATRERCVYGNEDSELTIVIIGDSFATHLLQGLRGAFGEDYKIVPLTLGQCPVVDVPVAFGGESKIFENCIDHNKKNLALIEEISPEALIVSDATRTTYHRMVGFKSEQEEVEAYKLGADRAYASIEASYTGPVVLIESPPHANCEPHNRLSKPRDCSSAKSPENISELQDYKTKSAEQRGFEVIDMRSWLCSDEGACPLLVGNTLTRADGVHLTSKFSARLSKIFRDEIGPSLPGHT